MRCLEAAMHGYRAQAGIALAAALVFLLLLTSLAFGALGRALLHERMAGNLRDAEQARLAAETALRGVEWQLWREAALAGDKPPSCASAWLAGHCYRYDLADAALYGAAGLVTAFRGGRGWVGAGAATYRGPGGADFTAPDAEDASAALARPPVYMVEDLGPEAPPQAGPVPSSGDAGRRLFRITVRAAGARADTVSVLESVFAVGAGGDRDHALSRRRAWRELAHD